MKQTHQIALICLLFTTLLSCNQKEKTVRNSEVEQYKKFVSEMKARGFNTGNILVYENEKVIFVEDIVAFSEW